jgi:hypothetical protein
MYFLSIKKLIFGSIGEIDYDKSISDLYDASRPDFGYIVLVEEILVILQLLEFIVDLLIL